MNQILARKEENFADFSLADAVRNSLFERLFD